MEDRELLELAAKAVGITLEWDGPPNKWQPMYYEGKTYHSFEPLTDDGDALRLAVKLSMNLEIGLNCCIALVGEKGASEVNNNDVCAATRLAIVRMAAEIGRAI